MEYIKLMRPKHYIKNFLIFLPLLFSGKLLSLSNILITLGGVICFSLVASSIYIINDIKDREKDRQHKTKCKRPIASGKISVRNALIFMFFLLIIVALLVIVLDFSLLSIGFLGLYFLLNLFYSLGLKDVPLVDIIILVSGFVIRVLFGASLLAITVSNWLYLTVIAISFYLGLGKRRNEIVKNGSKTRKVLKYYTKEFLDKNMYMFLTMTIIFYSLWTTDLSIVSKSNNLLIWTVPLVIIIAMKYSMDIEGESDGDPVEVIVHDKVIMALGLVYVLCLIMILYVL
ncbi:MAG TPA: UbiA prenyltransferase family protein [Candidatus Onthousia faecavium]|nr:UbiA prenyltransferase family protein [Candidatus Onthousia faecavium]